MCKAAKPGGLFELFFSSVSQNGDKQLLMNNDD